MKSQNPDAPQSFYIAVLLYECSVDTPDYQPLYEECFVLLKAAELYARHFHSYEA